MCDEQHRHLALQLIDGRTKVLGGSSDVQAAGRLIENEDLRLLDQCPRNRQAL